MKHQHSNSWIDRQLRWLMLGAIAMGAMLLCSRYANATFSTIGLSGDVKLPANAESTAKRGKPITTDSNPAKIALAQHLQEVGAKMYGAFWCPHCHQQKQLFGKEAVSYLNYIECATDDPKVLAQSCRDAGIRAYPTWEIDGELHEGRFSLDELADLSGYQGSRDFQ